jgi:hypothetical protein
MFEVVIVLVALAICLGTRNSEQRQVTVGLTFPRTVSADQATAAAPSLRGLLPPRWRRWLGVPAVVLEVRATASGIRHALTIPASRGEYVVGALRAAIPGLRVTDAPADAGSSSPTLAASFG